MLVDANGREYFVVDDHTHVGVRATPSRSAPGTEFSAEAIIEQMDRVGVDVAVAFPRADPTTDYRQQNEYLITSQERYPDRIVAFARIQPLLGARAVADIREYAERGVRGLKIHAIIDGGNHPVNNPDVMFAAMEEAARHHLAILFHSGGYFTCTPTLISDLAEHFPDSAYIVGHSGYELYEDALVAVRRTKNLYLDASELAGPGLIRRVVREAGADRLMFGSDVPARAIGWELGKIAKYAGLEPDELELVVGGNAARLLGIPTTTAGRTRVPISAL